MSMISAHSLEEIEEIYERIAYGELDRVMAEIRAEPELGRNDMIRLAGEIEERYEGKVVGVSRYGGEVYIAVDNGDEYCISEEFYRAACEDYCQTRMRRGTKIIGYHGAKCDAVVINN